MREGSCPRGVVVLWGSCPWGSCPQDTTLPCVPYLTEQYHILALVPSVPCGTGNVQFFVQ